MKLPKYHDVDLRTSIEIRRDAARRASDNRKFTAQFVALSVVGVVALYATLYTDLPAGSVARKLADSVLAYLSSEPWLLVFPLFLGFVVYEQYIHRRDIADNKIVRWIYRLFAWLPRRAFLALGALVALVFAALAGVLVTAAYFQSPPAKLLPAKLQPAAKKLKDLSATTIPKSVSQTPVRQTKPIAPTP